MSKREKIIIACMVAAVLYGAWSLIFDSGSKKVTAKKTVAEAPLENFVVDVIGQIKKADDSTTDEYLLAKAQGTVNRNPFYRETGAADKDAAASTRARDEKAAAIGGAMGRFSYTGYVEMGGNRLAILNGREFSEGDQLNAEGMYLKSISPSAVVIGHKGLAETTTIRISDTN